MSESEKADMFKKSNMKNSELRFLIDYESESAALDN